MNVSINSRNILESMSDSERAQYDVLFSVADVDRDQKINGLEGFNYFAQSGLPRDVLARVWTLSDVGAKGHLTPLEFRIATHLVFCLRRGEKLPSTISPSLIASAQDKKTNTIPTSYMSDWETARGKAAEMMKLTFSYLEAGKVAEALVQAESAGAELLPHTKRLYKEMEVCRNYTQALEILIESKRCDEEGAAVISAALVRFLSEIQLQAKHQAVCLRMSIGKNSAIENYGITARAIRELIRMNPGESATLKPRLDFCAEMGFQDSNLPTYECYHCARKISPAPTDCTHCGAPITVTYLLEQRKIERQEPVVEVPQDLSEFDSGLVVVHQFPVPKLRSILKGGQNWTPRPVEQEDDEEEDTEKSTKKSVIMGSCQTQEMSWMDSPQIEKSNSTAVGAY